MRFNNPVRHNAVSVDMWKSVPEIMTEFENDTQIRVVVLSGAGGNYVVVQWGLLHLLRICHLSEVEILGLEPAANGILAVLLCAHAPKWHVFFATCGAYSPFYGRPVTRQFSV